MMCVGCTAHMPGGQLEPHMEPSPSNTTLGVLFVLWRAAWFVVRLGFLPPRRSGCKSHLPVVSCVTLGKLLNLSGLSFFP